MLSAQFGTTPQIINFPKTEYNASNQNWSIDQDKSGTVFVANNKGLLVYNGAWQLYELPGQQIVRAVLCDGERVYTGGFGEFGYWKKELLGDYSYHSLTKKINFEQFSKEEIWKISKLNGTIYFQSFSTIYVLENDNITSVPIPGNIMYAFQSHGHIYVQVLHQGLYELKDRRFILVSNAPIFQKDEIISILEGAGNTTLIGSVHNGIFQLNDGIVTPFPGAINSILKTAQLNVTIRLTDSTFAIGTIQKGVYILDNKGDIVEHFDQQNGLQNNTVLSLKKDLMGNLWVGLDRGLDEIVLQSPLRYFQDVSGEFGSVYATAQYNGAFYIGSNDGLYRYDREKGFQNVAGINWQVWSLDVLNDQLFCAHNSGVTVISGNSISHIPGLPGGWEIKILHSNPNYALQGTYIGLALYEKGKDGFFHYKQHVKGMETMPLSDWIEDAAGELWLKHAYRGISRIKLSQNCDSVVQSLLMKIGNGVVPDIRQNISVWDGQVYIVSSNGVKVWKEDKNSFEPVMNLWGLSDEDLKVKRIFPLPHHNFWIVKDDNQLLYVDSVGKQYPFFLKDFSLVGGYENIISIDSTRSILCGETGFALFSPDLLHNIQSKAPFLSSAYVNRSGDFEPISRWGRKDGDRWLVAYDNRSIKITAGIAVYDRLVQYRFKLTKYGDVGYWGEWQNTPSKVYTNLSAGDYIVEIQTNMGQSLAYFEFTILAPWYWTWWSKTVYVLLLGCLVYLVYRKMEKKHQLMLLKKQQEMEKKLAMQKMEHEHELLLLRQEKLEKEVQFKSEDLANSANELIKRKKLLNKLHIEIAKQQDGQEQNRITPSMKRLSKELERQLKLDKDETKFFEHGFNTVHEQFFSKLLEQYPGLTPQDIKLAAYLRMNLGSKEIAPLLNITVRGVELKRYRLRKKLQLGEDTNLNEFMMRF
ncbi:MULTISPECIES: hypothetical protein [Chitinophagaceae]